LQHVPQMFRGTRMLTIAGHVDETLASGSIALSSKISRDF